MRTYVFFIFIIFGASLELRAQDIELDIKTEKHVLDYKTSLESFLKQKIGRILKDDELEIGIEIKLLTSSQKIKSKIKANKNFALPFKTLDNLNFNKIFVNKIDVKIKPSKKIMPHKKAIAENFLRQEFKGKKITITFDAFQEGIIKKTASHLVETKNAIPILIFFSIICILIVLRYRNKTKQLPQKELSDAEEDELTLHLDLISRCVSANKELFNKVVRLKNNDYKALKTLGQYLEMKFDLSEIYGEDLFRKVSKETGYLSQKDFKLWMIHFVEDVKKVMFNKKVKKPFAFDYSAIERCSIDDFSKIIVEMEVDEIVSILFSIPHYCRFKVLEAVKKVKSNYLPEIMERLVFNDESEDFSVVEKLISDIKTYKKYKNSHEKQNAA